MRLSNELKAGVVILVGIGLIAMFYVRTSKVETKTYQIKTTFGYAGDLKNNAVVKLSGIEVGRLKSINFQYDPDTKVECVLELKDGVKVRKDAIAYIGTAGFVGDAYIGITAGAAKEFVSPDEVIPSEDPIQMRELLKKADKIASTLDDTLKEVKGLAANANTAVTNFNGILTDNKKGISNIVSNLEGTTKNFEEFSEDVKKHPWKLLFKGE
ncbi:MAG TPA: MlaD family protein [Candidatus Omnitrophota bacterium]|nr:MlaD family protein [Candidatus Omnitrophota bacterium]